MSDRAGDDLVSRMRRIEGTSGASGSYGGGAGAAAGSTGAGDVQQQLSALSAQMQGIREDNKKIQESLQGLSQLKPLVEQLSQLTYAVVTISSGAAGAPPSGARQQGGAPPVEQSPARPSPGMRSFVSASQPYAEPQRSGMSADPTAPSSGAAAPAPQESKAQDDDEAALRAIRRDLPPPQSGTGADFSASGSLRAAAGAGAGAGAGPSAGPGAGAAFPNPAAPEPPVDEEDALRAAQAEDIPPHGLVEDGKWTAAPVPVESDIRIWTGTWNLGAKDPFHKKDITKSMDLVTRTLEKFIPLDYDVYVVGVQEAMSDSLYQAIAAYTGCFQLPLYSKLEPAKESKDSGTHSRRMGRAICVQEFLDDFADGKPPTPVTTVLNMMDRVYGRGDGALLRPKFTGIAVFVSAAAAPYVRLLGVYKHSFGATEGSKGGVGVALGVYDQTMAFVNCHLASKRIAARQQQYSELVERLGAKLGGRGFGLNEEFHHIVWMGDLNYHCTGVTAEEVATMIKQGRLEDLLMHHDELIQERFNKRVFFNYDEPLMPRDFFPTYKKVPHRGTIDYDRDPDWVKRVYELYYKEPLIKGGRTVERVPSWTDRIQYHSLRSTYGRLLPESTDPDQEGAPQNYRPVNDGMDISDHSPVFATWRLRIKLDACDDDAVAEAAAARQRIRGCAIGTGTHGISVWQVHPVLRPVHCVVIVKNVRILYKKGTGAPRALSLLFPLPFEDGDDLPERSKAVRMPSAATASHSYNQAVDSVPCVVNAVVSRAGKIPDLHLLLKVSLDDGTKAQTVVQMRDLGIDVPVAPPALQGAIERRRHLPLISQGRPAESRGHKVAVEFTVDFRATYLEDDEAAEHGLALGLDGYTKTALAQGGPGPASGGAGALDMSAAADRLRGTGGGMGASGSVLASPMRGPMYRDDSVDGSFVGSGAAGSAYGGDSGKGAAGEYEEDVIDVGSDDD